MSTLVIDVEDTERRVHERFTFYASPVRIGRSQLNELPLPFDFVSHCHGILTFRAGSCEYVDLGSTNGTFVEGARIEKNVPHMLGPKTVLSIGKLRLTARQTTEHVSSRSSYAFDAERLLHEAEALSPSAPAQFRSEADLSTRYEAYRNGWEALYEALSSHYRALPESAREAWISRILRAYPDLPQEAAFRALVSGEPSAARGTSTSIMARLVARLTGEDPRALGRTPAAELEQQVVAVLARSMQAFVELRAGHEHFMAEMGLCAVRPDESALSGITNAADALRYFLGTDARPGRLEELARAYTDIMTHQVALLNGVIAGVRELLTRLEGAPLAPRPHGLVAFLARLFGQDAERTAQRRLLADLRDEGALTAALFGRAFARTYGASIGQERDRSASIRTVDAIPPRDAA